MSTRVRERDNGAKALLKHFRGGVLIRAGIMGSAASAAHPKAGMPVGELAAIHELGAGVPRRSFLRSTFDRDLTEVKKRLRRIAQAAADGTNPRGAADRFGAGVVKSIVETINANIPPPLKPATVAKKGHDLALVDTGTLRGHVDHDVEVSK